MNFRSSKIDPTRHENSGMLKPNMPENQVEPPTPQAMNGGGPQTNHSDGNLPVHVRKMKLAKRKGLFLIHATWHSIVTDQFRISQEGPMSHATNPPLGPMGGAFPGGPGGPPHLPPPALLQAGFGPLGNAHLPPLPPEQLQAFFAQQQAFAAAALAAQAQVSAANAANNTAVGGGGGGGNGGPLAVGPHPHLAPHGQGPAAGSVPPPSVTPESHHVQQQQQQGVLNEVGSYLIFCQAFASSD